MSASQASEPGVIRFQLGAEKRELGGTRQSRRRPNEQWASLHNHAGCSALRTRSSAVLGTSAHRLLRTELADLRGFSHVGGADYESH